MSRTVTFKTVLATVSVALGIGFFVQIGETPSVDARAPERTTVPRAVTVVTNTQSSSVFGVPPNSHSLVDHVSDVQHVAFVRQNYSEENPSSLGVISAVPRIEDPCKVSISAIPMPAAMAMVTINAPCHQHADFVVSHESFRFSGQTEATGRIELVVPILAADAKIAILFDNIEFARTAIYVPDVSQYDRTILQWRGDAHLQLHVLESGANIGQSGHIWTGSSHTYELAILGQRGFVTSYGTDTNEIPFQAEAYTFPARSGRDDISVTMPIGLMVTQKNCGRLFDVQLIQVVSGQVWSPIDVAIDVPTCDAAGKFVMLPDAIASYTRMPR
jgi:hypothetical protein